MDAAMVLGVATADEFERSFDTFDDLLNMTTGCFWPSPVCQGLGILEIS